MRDLRFQNRIVFTLKLIDNLTKEIILKEKKVMTEKKLIK
jgi:hypothetical protein